MHRLVIRWCVCVHGAVMHVAKVVVDLSVDTSDTAGALYGMQLFWTVICALMLLTELSC